ncbi:hypothetical protein M0R45_036023 [Rubus argutus]|uniref:Uncharacterized protein n=1 Tax=Rubus argutus TaxID=59490 RepID=A0AAW1VWD2_RUBAR
MVVTAEGVAGLGRWMGAGARGQIGFGLIEVWWLRVCNGEVVKTTRVGRLWVLVNGCGFGKVDSWSLQEATAAGCSVKEGTV